jgi:hypothetical protein
MARRIVRLDPRDDEDYRTAVAPLTPLIERALGDPASANRAGGRGRARTTRLEPWRRARRTWSADLRAAIAADPVALVTDVRRCYDSIRPEVLGRQLEALGAERDQVAAVRALLERFGEPGLPVGPDPSAILANAVLVELDVAFRASGLRHLRWVDDVVAVARTRREALAGLDGLRRAMDAVGLESHPAKTAVVEGGAALRRRLRERPSSSTAAASAVR